MHIEIDSWGNSHPSLKVHIKYILGIVQIGEVWSKSIHLILVQK